MKPVSLMGLVFEAYGVRAGTPYDVEFRLAPLAAAERILAARARRPRLPTPVHVGDAG